MDKLSLHVCDEIVKMERHAFLSGYYKAFSYGAHSCRRCEVCALAEGQDEVQVPDRSPAVHGIGRHRRVRNRTSNAGVDTKVVKDRNILKPEMLPTYTLLLLE